MAILLRLKGILNNSKNILTNGYITAFEGCKKISRCYILKLLICNGGSCIGLNMTTILVLN